MNQSQPRDVWIGRDSELMRYVQLHERELNAPSMILDHLWMSPMSQ